MARHRDETRAQALIDIHKAAMSVMRPKTQAVLKVLLDSCDELVTKRELHEHVWGDVVVGDDTIVQSISEIRLFLADWPELEIKNVPRKGYIALWQGSDQRDNDSIPTIVVLPFTNISGRKRAAFSHGLTENIITELSRQKDVSIIARHSAESYRDSGIAPETIVEELGVRYLLQGSVQIQNEQVRVNAQLSDRESHAYLWSERYLRSAEDFFVAQDEISFSIVNRIAGTAGIIMSTEHSRLKRRSPQNFEAFENYVMGANVADAFSNEGSRQAIEFFRMSTAQDPSFARAWSRMAAYHLIRLAYTYDTDIEETGAEFVTAALKSIELDPNDAFSAAMAGGAYCALGELHKGKEWFDRALALGPNDADTIAAISYIRPTKFGSPEDDLPNIIRAMSLNPFYPEWYALSLGYCAFHAKDYDRSIESLTSVDSNVLDAQLYLALSHAALGEKSLAKMHASRLIEIKPDFSASLIVEADNMCDAAAKHFLGVAAQAGLAL